MLAISVLWISTVIWPAGFTREWTYVPALQASAFCAAVAAVFAIGLFRSVLRAFVFALIAVLAIVVVPRVPAPFVSDATSHSVRVFALNTSMGAADRGALVDRVRELNPDVVVLSETTVEEADAVAEAAGMKVTGAVDVGPGADGVAILAKQDSYFGDSRDQELTRFQNPLSMRPLMEPGGKPLAVMGVHTVAPIGDDRPDWDRELEALAHWADQKKASDTAELIVAGDFNATRLHPRFRDINLEDCTGHMAHTPSWPSVLPVLRLDHIMTTGECHSGGQVAVAGTDHRGVWADISA